MNRTIQKQSTLLSLCLAAMLSSSVFAAGLLKPIGASDDSLAIKSHLVNVTINNGYARTEVDQIFSNSSNYDYEAVYTFPLPKNASLSEVSLWIAGQEVIGEVLEKKKAKQVYEDQVAKGNKTALAEKDDYRTFDISVSPVKAGEDTRIRFVYYQPVEIDLNVGRYVYPLQEGGVNEERISFWEVDDRVTESFKFDLKLKSAFPIKDVRLPGHVNQASIVKEQADEQQALSDVYNVTIDNSSGGALTNDIVVYYRLADDVPARVELVPYKQDKKSDGTFMVVVTPAADLQTITEGVDWVFVLDKSGSMAGGKIATLADGVSKVINKMAPDDRFRIITFNENAQDFTNGYVNATPANVQSTLAQIKLIQAGGSTNLYAGIQQAYNKLDDDRTTAVILVTDGVANVGNTEHKHFIKLCKQYDIRLFTFVIGNSANQPLMDSLAKESNGFAMNISNNDDIIGKILQAKAKVLRQAIHGVELKFHGERVSKVTPSKPGSLYHGQQLVMFGKYNSPGDVQIELKGKVSGQEKSWTCNAVLPEIDTDNPEIERLWALASIDEVMEKIRLDGEKESLRKEIVSLATEYSLVTDYTSMVVVNDVEAENMQLQRRNADRVSRERQAQQTRNTQPVKNYRVDQNKQNPSGNQGMFDGRSAPGIGSGPVGPAFIALALWMKKRNKKA